MSDALDRTILPVEEQLHSTPVALIGSFHCPPDHRFFADSGPARNHIFVFPRSATTIQRDDQPAFVSTPQNLTFYNRGQAYTRKPISEHGDVCDFFAVHPALLVDTVRAFDPTVDERADRPFPFAATPLPTRVFLQERRLIERLRAGVPDPLEIDEAVVDLLDAVLRGVPGTRPRPIDTRSAAAVVEYAKQALAESLDTTVAVTDIAETAGVSVYHLCKLFRRRMGMTMTQYRLQLRLRLAFDLVPQSNDLLATALDLGFPTHAYFTYAFRTAFGVTPSAHRRKAAARPPQA